MSSRRIESITVITPNYPEKKFPEKGAFVEKHVAQWQRDGIKVDVIAPYSVPNLLRSINRQKHEIDIAGSQIKRPLYMSFSNKKIGKLDLEQLSYYCYREATSRAAAKTAVPDIFYGKFLMRAGHAALKTGKKYNRAVVADLGESKLLESMNSKSRNIAQKIVPQFSGFACVSKRLVNEVKELGADPEDILYAPNTVDTERFYPMNKKESRSKLNLPPDDFIVIFVGHFIERKGPLRVLEAINSLDKNVKGIFLGRGSRWPEGSQVLHTGSVPNSELSKWLNAADVFVLPTLAEGNCNAINEAVACGLPIISSDISDVRPQVTERMGILVNPFDSGEIADAINAMYKNKYLLKEFSNECIREAEKRFSESRASKILKWMEGYL